MRKKLNESLSTGVYQYTVFHFLNQSSKNSFCDKADTSLYDENIRSIASAPDTNRFLETVKACALSLAASSPSFTLSSGTLSRKRNWFSALKCSPVQYQINDQLLTDQYKSFHQSINQLIN